MRSQKSLTQNKGNNDACEFKFFHDWVDQEYIPCGGGVREGRGYTLLRNRLQCPRPKKGAKSFCFLLKQIVRK